MEPLLRKELAENFRQRLKVVIERSGGNTTRFSRKCGIDRSALSQFLDVNSLRLPRSETLMAIANVEKVSLDWLLGLSQDELGVGEVASTLSIEHASPGDGHSLLTQWHKEAVGYKIRYSPSSLPDLLRTPAVTKYEFGDHQTETPEIKTDLSESQLAYSRMPETDIEIVMPFQRLENLASGVDIWNALERGKRQAQLVQASKLLDELYPRLRLFLYDGRKHFLAAYTVFGPKRAALYIGGMYMVVNSVDHIRQVSVQFDEMIKEAVITPDKASEWVEGLPVV